MPSRPNTRTSDIRYFTLLGLGLVFICFMAWFVVCDWHPTQVIANSDTKSIAHQIAIQKPDKSLEPLPAAFTGRPLEIDLPVIGAVHGSRWIKNAPIFDDGRPPEAQPDLLVDDKGHMLAAREGDSAYASLTNQEIYRKVLTSNAFSSDQSEAPIIKSIRHLPLPWPSDFISIGINRSSKHNFQNLRLATWVPLVVEYEDDPALYATMLRVSTSGTIIEGQREYWLPGLLLHHPKEVQIRYVKPVVAGANRFATLVFIETGKLGLPHYVEYSPLESAGMYLTEPWIGSSPWRDEQIDPFFGERRPDELFIPNDQPVRKPINQEPAIYQILQNADGEFFFPVREEAEARYQARLALEAAERNSKK